MFLHQGIFFGDDFGERLAVSLHGAVGEVDARYEVIEAADCRVEFRKEFLRVFRRLLALLHGGIAFKAVSELVDFLAQIGAFL